MNQICIDTGLNVSFPHFILNSQLWTNKLNINLPFFYLYELLNNKDVIGQMFKYKTYSLRICYLVKTNRHAIRKRASRVAYKTNLKFSFLLFFLKLMYFDASLNFIWIEPQLLIYLSDKYVNSNKRTWHWNTRKIINKK